MPDRHLKDISINQYRVIPPSCQQPAQNRSQNNPCKARSAQPAQPEIIMFKTAVVTGRIFPFQKSPQASLYINEVLWNPFIIKYKTCKNTKSAEKVLSFAKKSGWPDWLAPKYQCRQTNRTSSRAAVCTGIQTHFFSPTPRQISFLSLPLPLQTAAWQSGKSHKLLSDNFHTVPQLSHE